MMEISIAVATLEIFKQVQKYIGKRIKADLLDPVVFSGQNRNTFYQESFIKMQKELAIFDKSRISMLS